MARQGNSSGLVGTLTRPYGPDRDAPIRVVGQVAAVLSIGAGVIHFSAAGDHVNLPVMLAGFVVVGALQVGLGALLLRRRPSRLLLAAALALMVGSIGAWVLSRTAGLPFLEDGHREAVGFKDSITVLLEVASLPVLLLLMSRELDRVSLASPRLARQTRAALGPAAVALVTPALLLGGGGHLSHDQAVEAGIHGHDDGGHEVADAGAHSDDGHSDGEGHGKDHQRAGAEKRHGHGGGSSSHARSHESGGPAHGGGSHGHDGRSGGGTREHTTHRDDHDGEAHRDGRHDEGEHRGGDRDGDHDDHHGGGHGDGHGDHGDAPEGDEEEPISVTYEPARPAQDGRPARGGAIVLRSESGPYEEGAHSGEFHHGTSENCEPTPQQQAAADTLYAATNDVLRRYENNPAAALADGFQQVVGPADRFVHMIHIGRVFDPTILDPTEIESFMYAMTDRGLVPLGGMYIMPAEFRDGRVEPTEPRHGPEIGGCLTRWHKHEGWVAGVSTGGTNWEETPEMLHVWTYPGLDPWDHYDGPELSQLWSAWKDVPSFCRISPGGTNVCFP